MFLELMVEGVRNTAPFPFPSLYLETVVLCVCTYVKFASFYRLKFNGEIKVVVAAESGFMFSGLKLERCSVHKPLDLVLGDPSNKVH